MLEALDRFHPEPAPVDKPFRMAVQDLYKFSAQGDDRRIVAGTIETGTLRVGDEVVFYPSGKRTHVKSIEAFNRPPQVDSAAGQAAGFTLTEQLYVARGELATVAGEAKPSVTTRVRVSLSWLGKEPFLKKKEYLLKLGSAKVPVRLEEIHRVIDASRLATSETKDRVDRHDVAECILKLNRGVAFDLADAIAATSRFVVVDNYEIRGGGIIREALPDSQAWVREKVFLRNYKWEPSIIPPKRRAEKYNQRAVLLLITGARETARKTLAKDLEAKLFEDGRVVYYLGMASVLYGVDADIERKAENRAEHLRRMAEIANILLDAGAILIVTTAELSQDDVELIKTSVNAERIEVVWVGDAVTTDVSYDLILGEQEADSEGAARIKRLLQDKGALFRPW